MIRTRTNEDDPTIVALQALGVTLRDPDRAARLLDLTGIDADELRSRASEPALLVAVLTFLEAHEPDLIAVADELGLGPADLVTARRSLES